ncbi:RND transporter [Prauserella marina]|uniref:Putative drug exporter of the RND superfamily n=1 Tax=Prauserella marina TaxID=530584 RepID=A0A222VRD4_9PSEU|nr:MMPL family transporter [Prauserella marina]ASR36450.1 RND transporter [Prauserella marina]PWV77264.1 RND superfamily putative drug exporter [Prauserella marina]SDD08145.1 putative drug exporter of the RND superfamily [Prauserella marina]
MSLSPPLTSRPPVLERLGRFAVRRRRWVLLVGALVTVAAGVFGAGALNALSLSRIDAPGSESDRARTVLAEQFDTGPANLVFLVTATEGTVDDPAVAAEGERLTRALAGEQGVSEAGSYWSRGDSPALRSEDGTQALVLVRVPGEVNEARERVGELAERYAVSSGTVQVAAGGQDEVFREIGAQSRQDFLRAEIIVIPLVLILLILFYRRVTLALVTLGIGVFAIVGTLAALRGVASFTSVSTFAANIALVMGLALGVDYCLFLIARFREELRRGADVPDAVVTSVKTAGRTVLFSGLTVAISLLALMLFPLPFLRSFGYGGAFVVITAVAGALVLLPAALAVLGHRAAERGGAKRGDNSESGVWFRLAGAVMRRPVLTGGLMLIVVLALAAPVTGLRFGMPDARILPADSSSRAMADEVRTNFGQEESDALFAVAPGATEGGMAAYASELSRVDGIAQVDSSAGTFTGGTLTAPAEPGRFSTGEGDYVVAIPTNEALDGDAVALVENVRAVQAPFDVLVGGTPAEMADWRGEMTDRLPLVLVTILVLTFIILFLMTGSILLPLKATVLNLLSMGVMFGVLVWVFQDGNLSGLLGFTPTGSLESSIPILMFCIVYGLSMDYEVFIVSRIREEFLRTGDASAAVPLGLQRSAPLITTAAVILAASFAVYTTGGVVYLKMIGVGMAVAVLVDALLIRGILLPAFMRLAGGANWWAPAPLRRLHERFGLAEETPRPATRADALDPVH